MFSWLFRFPLRLTTTLHCSSDRCLVRGSKSRTQLPFPYWWPCWCMKCFSGDLVGLKHDVRSDHVTIWMKNQNWKYKVNDETFRNHSRQHKYFFVDAHHYNTLFVIIRGFIWLYLKNINSVGTLLKVWNNYLLLTDFNYTEFTYFNIGCANLRTGVCTVHCVHVCLLSENY